MGSFEPPVVDVPEVSEVVELEPPKLFSQEKKSAKLAFAAGCAATRVRMAMMAGNFFTTSPGYMKIIKPQAIFFVPANFM